MGRSVHRSRGGRWRTLPAEPSSVQADLAAAAAGPKPWQACARVLMRDSNQTAKVADDLAHPGRTPLERALRSHKRRMDEARRHPELEPARQQKIRRDTERFRGLGFLNDGSNDGGE